MITILFVWFILTRIIIPVINLLGTVFMADGSFPLEPIHMLLKSKKAMSSLRKSIPSIPRWV